MPLKIGEIIIESIKKMGFSERLHKQSAVQRWNQVVGDKIAAETKALKIDGDVLVVRVHSAAWRQQLLFLKDDLLEKLKNDLGDNSISDIRFV